MKEDRIEILEQRTEPWTVTLVDTGLESMTGGRLKRIAHLLDNESFCVTYGDGVANIDIPALVESHKSSRKLATVTAVSPPGRFGALNIDSNSNVTAFTEKPLGDGDMINGGFFVLEPEVLNLIESDATVWEEQPMHELVNNSQLNAYLHEGFWQPVDTLREKRYLEELYQQQRAPWILW